MTDQTETSGPQSSGTKRTRPMSIRSKMSSVLRGRYVPTWVFRVVDGGRYLAGLLNRYPLADRADSMSCKPLFIVGAGRSGTTLLRSMLVAGGQVAVPPESQVIGLAARRYVSLQFLGWRELSRLIVALFEGQRNFQLWKTNLHPAHRIVVNLQPAERSLARVIDEVFQCYVSQQFSRASLWGDKSPINAFHLPRILATFPEARYLHLLRDGRDAISSMVARGRDIRRATDRWVASVEQVLDLQSELAPSQFLEVRYEHLVSEPQKALGRICGFLDVQYTSRMLDFWKLPTTVEYEHYEHHRNLSKPVFTDSIGKWTKRLTQGQQEYVLSKTSRLLKQFAYIV